MLITDVWEALEYLAFEPPAHVLLRGQAKFFGYEFAVDKKKEKSKPVNDRKAAGELMRAVGGGSAKPLRQAPKSFQNLVGSDVFRNFVAGLNKKEEEGDDGE